MDTERTTQLQQLGRRLGLEFSDLDLVNTAFTHQTYVFEHPGKGLVNNQRLEFLGDAVLGLIVGEELYRYHSEVPEGDLTKMRSALVCEPSLARLAQNLDLGSYLLLGRGELLNGGRQRASTLADLFEAFLAAIYLQFGLPRTKEFLLAQLGDEIKNFQAQDFVDYKTTLQEEAQKKFGQAVSYELLAERGPDHAKEFLVAVKLGNELLAKGKGASKKEAQQLAASRALHKISPEHH